jgi:hypothetical protein
MAGTGSYQTKESAKCLVEESVNLEKSQPINGRRSSGKIGIRINSTGKCLPARPRTF